LREDVSAEKVRREPDPIAAMKPERKSSARHSPRKRPGSGQAMRAGATSGHGRPIQLTHPQRVLFPADRVTKQQLADYYEAVAPVLWPHLRSRPLSLVRSTNAQGSVFFQRHIVGKSVPGLESVRIPGSDEEPYFVCSSEASIPLLAQMGAVELHTWGSKMPRPDVADRITFDLDPDPTLPWAQVREAATLVRGLLLDLGVQVLLKTTGGLGLHLVAPLQRGPPMEVAATFSRRVAEHLARLDPQRFSARRGASNRQGRIYVDWQRNQFAATTVAAYSPRHRPGVPVSLPVHWEELGKRDIRARFFNLRNVAARVAEQGDAWADAPLPRQALTRRAIDRLEAAAGAA
jgi:bifunctional non-homologous end joining protein LigD